VAKQNTEFYCFQNVIHDGLGSDWEGLLEAAYLQRFFHGLENLMGDRFQRIKFLIINQNSRWSRIAPSISGQDVVLVWLADEAGSIPYELSPKFRLILKSYWPLRDHVGNLHPFPLCGSSSVLGQKQIPFSERHTNVFFCGNLNANRIDFYRRFTPWGNLPPWNFPSIVRKLLMKGISHLLSGNIPRDFSSAFPDSEIRFTEGFQQGYPPSEFAARLADTRIALCPPGFMSNETIRHFEAMSLGCAVISAQLPGSSLYADSPIVQIRDWGSLRREMLSLLGDEHRLRTISNDSLAWWNNVLSPEAMAYKTYTLLQITETST
jgi:hypothetical protein